MKQTTNKWAWVTNVMCRYQLLRKNPNVRLGAKPKRADAIRRHRFFRTIDWDALLRREISPPIVPIVVCEIQSNLSIYTLIFSFHESD